MKRKKKTVWISNFTYTEERTFDRIADGDFFAYEGIPHVKIRTDMDWYNGYDSRKVNAIDLVHGSRCSYFDDDKVFTSRSYGKICSHTLGKEQFVYLLMLLSILIIVDCILVGILHILPIWIITKVLLFVAINTLIYGWWYYNGI